MKRKLIILCLMILCFASFYKWVSIKQRQQGVIQTKEGLISIHQQELRNLEEVTEQIDVSEEIKPLNEINTDYVGWIKIEGTEIDYPVTQARNNEYYLWNDFYGNYSIYGNIFMDYRNTIEDHLIIIYGHSGSERLMFSDLLQYEDQSFFQEYQTIEFMEKDYQICSVNIVDVDNIHLNYWDLPDDWSKTDGILQNLFNESLYQQQTVDPEAKYILLSTCIPNISTQRFVVIAEKK